MAILIIPAFDERVKANAEAISKSILENTKPQSLYLKHEIIVLTNYKAPWEADTFSTFLEKHVKSYQVMEISTMFADYVGGGRRYANINYAFRSIMYAMSQRKEPALVAWLSEKGNELVGADCLDTLDQMCKEYALPLYYRSTEVLPAVQNDPEVEVPMGTIVYRWDTWKQVKDEIGHFGSDGGFRHFRIQGASTWLNPTRFIVPPVLEDIFPTNEDYKVTLWAPQTSDNSNPVNLGDSTPMFPTQPKKEEAPSDPESGLTVAKTSGHELTEEDIQALVSSDVPTQSLEKPKPKTKAK